MKQLPGPFIAADWPARSRIRALTTLRRGDGNGCSLSPFDDFNLGDRCGDDPQAVATNREALQRLLRLPSAPLWLHQVHGCAVCLADGTSPGAMDTLPNGPPIADAAVTRVAGEVLVILSADCLPVLFCAVDGSEVAAAHAGWRGLAGGVLEATLAAMQTAPDRVMAWLGPAAGPRAYEVGTEVRDPFVDGDAESNAAFAPTRPGHWLCDLYRLAGLRLRRAGVGSIHGGQHCTISESQRFFSHRRDGRSGRMASLIWIEPA